MSTIKIIRRGLGAPITQALYNTWMNETIDLLLRRRSVRSFSAKQIEESLKRDLYETMRRAPTAGNQTLYSVIDIVDEEKKRILADSCDHQAFIANAPWVVVFVADMQRIFDYFRASQLDELAERTGVSIGHVPLEADALLATCDAMIAAHTLSVAADSVGIGSCYIGDILENYERVAELLSLPRYALPVTMLTLGYPDNAPINARKTERMPIESFVFENTYRWIDSDELAELYSYNESGSGRFLPGATNFGQHTYLRKFSADFMVEMRRSVRAMLENWR